MKLFKYLAFLSLAASFLLVTLGAFNFARGDRESAKAFFLIGILAAVISVGRIIALSKSK